MKNFISILIFILILFRTININSQTQWILQNSNTTENLYDIRFSSNYGYAVGNNGTVVRTTNNGTNWVKMNFPVTYTLYCVYFVNTSTGFVGCDNNNIYRTTNYGATWNTYGPSFSSPIVSITYPSNTSVGWAADRSGHIYKTYNYGLNWDMLYTTPGTNPKGFGINSDHVWFVDSYGYVSYTLNSGNNFSSVQVSNDTLSSVFFTSSTNGFACGDSGRVYQTNTSGASWTLMPTPVTTKLKTINCVSPYYMSLVRVFGNNGRILESVDNGATWISQTYGNYNYNAAYVTPSSINLGTAWAVGDQGKIIKSVVTSSNFCMGNDTLSADYPFTTYWMDARTQILIPAGEIHLGGGNTGYITEMGFDFKAISAQIMNGFSIKMQSTYLTSLTSFVTTGWNNSEVYWGTYAPPAIGLQYIPFINNFYWNGTDNILIEICFNNSSYTTNNIVKSKPAPGMTWHQHGDLPSGDGCTSFFSGTPQQNRPEICFTFNYLVSGRREGTNVPEKFVLEQNYPNPFNPVSKIKYQIAKNSLVKLKVFDITGKEINTLVNEEQTIGIYEATFDGSSLSSGVYFYQLRAGEYSETKKMIIIK
jgi:photosystem II stability/assembly factor-like uncharacterized protein